MTTYFDNVIFDLDSTLCSIEGVDELARGKGCLDKVRSITNLAMNGELGFHEVLASRLQEIKPQRRDLESLSHQYVHTLIDGSRETFRELRLHGSRPHIITGGYTQALGLLRNELNISQENIHAIDLIFDDLGTYFNYDQKNILCQPGGKRYKVIQMREQFPGQSFAMVGDGMGDAETGDVVDRFICFAGISRRPAVMEKSAWVVEEPNLLKVLPFLKV